MNMQRFRSPRAKGLFEGDPAGYSSWASWAGSITAEVSRLEREHALMSSRVPPERMGPLAELCSRDPESAIHVLVGDILQGGASWTHVALVRKLAVDIGGDFPDFSDIGGQFFPQLVRTLAWYQRAGGNPAESVTVQGGFRRCVAPGENGGGVEAERHGDGLRVLVSGSGDHAAAAYLDRESSGLLLAGLAAISGSPYRDRKPLFLGTGGGGEDREGLSVVSSNMGDPFRETIMFGILAPGWTTLSSVDVGIREAREMAKGLEAMMGADKEAAPGTGNAPRR